MNEKLAFALAVESPVPYGVPRGAIVDVATGRRRQADNATVSSSPTSSRTTGRRGRTRTRRWTSSSAARSRSSSRRHATGARSRSRPPTRCASSADRIELQTVMTNGGDVPLADLLSGQTLWPSAGYFFGIPGLGDLQEGKSTGALADRAVAYDADWSITLHAPYLNFVGSRSKDLFLQHTLQPGESRTLRCVAAGRRAGRPQPRSSRLRSSAATLPAGTLRGSVKTSATASRSTSRSWSSRSNGTPYAGVSVTTAVTKCRLPAGEYEIYATGKGYSQSKAGARDGRHERRGDVRFHRRRAAGPGRLHRRRCAQRRSLLDARIGITAGQRQLVEFLGRNTFFTELDRKGRLQASVAPGSYTLHGVVRWRLSRSEPGRDARCAARADGRFKGGADTALRPTDERLVCGRPAPSRRPGRGCHATGVPGALATRRRTRPACSSAITTRLPTTRPLQRIADARGVPFIPVARVVAVVGTLQCVAAAARTEARDRHGDRDHRRSTG